MAVALAIPSWAEGRYDARGNRNSGSQLGVARVSLADGDVVIQRAGTGDRMQALGGMPMVAGDSISTGRNSRVEVELGRANFVRLAPESKLRIDDLGNRNYRVEVVSGTVMYSELPGGEADTNILTPHVTVLPTKKGEYRIDVLEAGQTNVAVRKGEAEVISPDGSEVLKKGRRIVVRGEASNTEVRMAKLGDRDSFAQWNKRRNKLLADGSVRRGWAPFYGPYYPYWAWSGWGYYPFYRPYPYAGVGGTVVISGGGGGRGGHRGRH
jgi:hypothetical protein